MLSVFSNMVEDFFEVLMDDFSIHRSSFEHYPRNLGKIVVRCEEKCLVHNWKKCHFIVKQGIVLGHVVSKNGIQVNRAKIDITVNLPIPKSVKVVH